MTYIPTILLGSATPATRAGQTVSAHIIAGNEGAPPGMATIDIAVEALKCAEYLTPLLQEALKK